MLEIKNLVKSFKKVKAIDNISFSLNKGEIAILCGPNGAGKTTTLKCVLSLLKKDSGEILINGNPSSDRSVRETLAYIPETPDLYPLLTVWEHFKFIALAYNIKDWTSKAEEYIEAFNLADKKDTLAKELSKGMKQKVSIIMALIHNPDIFFIDEPFVGLDPQGIKEFSNPDDCRVPGAHPPDPLPRSRFSRRARCDRRGVPAALPREVVVLAGHVAAEEARDSRDLDLAQSSRKVRTVRAPARDRRRPRHEARDEGERAADVEPDASHLCELAADRARDRSVALPHPGATGPRPVVDTEEEGGFTAHGEERWHRGVTSG